jgi:DNA repair protein RadC
VNTDDSSKLNTLALLDRLKTDMPEIWSQAQIVGKWVWLEFAIPPLKEVRAKLKELGFHWNAARKCWQHSCGVRRPRSGRDPRGVYPVVPATAMELQETPEKPAGMTSKEYKVIALRECPLPESMQMCDTPDKAADYWRMNVATCPYFNPECECFVVLLLNTRRRVKGHQLLTIGTLDTILVHPREVFRAAVIAAAAVLVLMHNHPSGEPQPSEADIKVTRDLIRAGQLLKIEVLDHVIMGNPNHCSLRELGYWAGF